MGGGLDTMLSSKLWLGVGTFALVGVPVQAAPSLASDPTVQLPGSSPGRPSLRSGEPLRLAVRSGGEAGEAGAAREGGEGGEGGEHRERRRNHRGHAKQYHARERGTSTASQRPAPREGVHSSAPGPLFETLGLLRSTRLLGGCQYGGGRGAGGEGGERGYGGESSVNDRYIFGFTEGSDVERCGEREFEVDAKVRAGKEAGRYVAIEEETEFEYGVTDKLLAAGGVYTTYKGISNVPGLDNRHLSAFDGAAAEIKYQFVNRHEAPFGIGISAEPEYHLYSDLSGRREDTYEVETRFFVDREFIPNRLYGAINLLYEPELAHVLEFDNTGRFVNFERESTFGVSGALAYQVFQGVIAGGEVRYLAKYSGLGLNMFEGDALYFGPTLSVRPRPNVSLTMAFSIQATGRVADNPADRLNLDEFEKYQGRVRFVYEF